MLNEKRVNLIRESRIYPSKSLVLCGGRAVFWVILDSSDRK
jgi:hypothetical protein